ncbi:zinc finger MYM-type protein 1-like isoform X2 [Gymnodraco acuticeps]|uniref:Zinc finger MYM-type protein 1-like isoform X2 n=1 Tax=Gymnodraco acuticeps TaxID=8218 RepID=A0A6P8TP89_GYMAC|nr:zinc finger MYM-type protein 1-like isoform X2 [Gymnodraco acuticeps]
MDIQTFFKANITTNPDATTNTWKDKVTTKPGSAWGKPGIEPGAAGREPGAEPVAAGGKPGAAGGKPGEMGAAQPVSTLPLSLTYVSPTAAATDLGDRESGPSQPILPDYPKMVFRKQRRSFSSEYYKTYTFVEYCKEADAMFCFPCRQFQCSSGYRDSAFLTNSVRDWKNVLLKLQRLAECGSHRQCMELWQGYVASKTTGSVAAQLSGSHRAIVKCNREYAADIVDMVLYLGKQGLPLRGHDERESSSNRGHFLELCKWFSKRNTVFSSRLNGPFNLTSHDTQNELLEIAAKQVQNIIIRSIEDNGFYTILVDEARSFKQEQMTVCVR